MLANTETRRVSYLVSKGLLLVFLQLAALVLAPSVGSCWSGSRFTCDGVRVVEDLIG